MRSNLSSLKSLASQMSTTQTRLSTGKKVNSAIDNANSYYQSRALTNRASDLDMLLDSMGQSIQTITTATQGIENGLKIIEQMKSLANEAASIYESKEDRLNRLITEGYTAIDSSMTTADLQNLITSGAKLVLADDITLTTQLNIDQDNITIDGNGNKITYDASGTSNNGIYITAANAKINQLELDYTNLNITTNYIGAIVTQSVGSSLDVSNSHISMVKDATTKGRLSALVANNGSTINMENVDLYVYGNWTSFVNANDNSTINIFGANNFNGSTHKGIYNRVDGICNIDGTINIKSDNTFEIHGFFNANTNNSSTGNIINISGNSRIYSYIDDNVIYNQYTGGKATSDNIINIASGATFATGKDGEIRCYQLNNNFSDVNSPISGVSNIYTFDDLISAVASSPAKMWDLTPTSNPLCEQFNAIYSQYDAMVKDASYQGINLLDGGNLNVMFNETRTHSHQVEGYHADAAALGINTAAWSEAADIEATITQLQNATSRLRNIAGDLGNHLSIIETRQDFTDNLIDVLETGADNLVLADMNEESANYLALQTRQQLAVNSLSLASQSAQSVLSLF